MRIAILTVFYPKAKKYLKKFINSLDNQTHKEFTLMIVNEGLKLKNLKHKFPIKIIKGFKNDGQKNRIEGLIECKKEGYDVVICADADDLLDKNRVKSIYEYYKKNKQQIAFSNAINKKNSFQTYKKKIITYKDLLEYNVLGFGCLSLRINLIDKIKHLKNKHIKIFDWWLFSILIFDLKRITVLKNSKVKYLDHTENIVGPTNLNMNNKKFEDNFINKINHYFQMRKYCKKIKNYKMYNIYDRLYTDYKNTYKFYLEKPKEYNNKVENFFKLKNNFFWFENIVSLKKLKKKI